MTDVKSTIDEHDEWTISTAVQQFTEDKKRDLHQNLDIPNVVNTMEFIFDSWAETFVSQIKKDLAGIEHSKLENSKVILCEIEPTPKDERTDFKGIDIAYNQYIKNPDGPLILTSFLSIQQLIKVTENSIQNKLTLLLSKPNVKFIRLPFLATDLPKLFTDNTNKDQSATEESFQKIIESEISRFLHDAKYWIELWSWDKTTYEEQLKYLFDLPQDKKNDKWIMFEDKLIALLQIQHPSFKLLPREQNLQWIVDMYKYSRANVLPEWSRFEGVFVDWDGTLYDNKKLKFNQNIIDMIKDYETQWKKIIIRTWGNLEMKQKLLDAIWLDYTIENKTNYKWWTVEIAIDNDSQEYLRANAKIKAEQHIKA